MANSFPLIVLQFENILTQAEQQSTENCVLVTAALHTDREFRAHSLTNSNRRDTTIDGLDEWVG